MIDFFNHHKTDQGLVFSKVVVVSIIPKNSHQTVVFLSL